MIGMGTRELWSYYYSWVTQSKAGNNVVHSGFFGSCVACKVRWHQVSNFDVHDVSTSKRFYNKNRHLLHSWYKWFTDKKRAFYEYCELLSPHELM